MSKVSRILVALSSGLALVGVLYMAMKLRSAEREIEQALPVLERLEHHCEFERIKLDALYSDLDGTHPKLSRARAGAEFEALAVDDFRSVKLCTPEGAWFDPDAIFCGPTFRNDTGCMRSIVKLARSYVR